MMRIFAYSAIAAASLLTTAMAEIDPIVIKGSKFFHEKSGEQFFMKGVAYQQGVGKAGTATQGSDSPDPLADADGCKRDVPLLKELETNAIRVYAIDPTKDHDECMSLLADAGIYVIADLSEPDMSINRDTPAWTDDLYTRYVNVIDTMAPYDNFMGGFAGNEVSNAKNNTNASAFVKAAVRDIKAYISFKEYRPIGIGYATNDDADIRENMADYFNCGPSEESVDFYGYNIYSWCGKSTYTDSGYDIRTEEFKNYNVPVFFAEYGCNEGDRLFGDTPVLYKSPMSDVWSGGIVYMYFEEENEYGLVQLNGNSVKKLDDFEAYKDQITKVSPKGTTMDQYNPSGLQASKCPPVNQEWGAAASPLPPAANPQLCSCMMESLTCVVKPDVALKEYEDIFDYACSEGGKDTCLGTFTDAEKGEYGAYSMCNAEEQLSWVLTQFQQGSKDPEQACDFKGKAQIQQPKNLEGECKSLVDQAGENGEGTVNAEPADAEDSEDAAGHLALPILYVLGAVFAGTGLLLL